MTCTTDAAGHTRADSGCPIATEYLGRPSLCLNCPFPRKCVLEVAGIGVEAIKKQKRNQEIRRMAQDGVKVATIARKFGISWCAVSLIIKTKCVGDKLWEKEPIDG